MTWTMLAAIAAGALLAYAAVFYPGAMGFDVAYQWWQSRGGETTNIHGIGMTWLWRLANFAATGPGVLFLLQLSLLFAGTVLIAMTLPIGRLGKFGLPVLAIAAPVCFVQFSAVGSDVMLAAVLCFALGATVAAGGKPRASPALIALVLTFLLFALMLRKNALPAVFPLLVYAIQVARRSRNSAMDRSGLDQSRLDRSGLDSIRLRASFAIGIALIAVMQISCWVVESTVDRRVTLFPGTAVWDLAEVSVRANENLLPQGTYGPGLTIDDLSQALVPYANTTLFAKTHAGMRQPFLGETDPLNEQIRDAWIDAIRRFPRYYLDHRWQVTRALFGSKSAEWPHELVYYSDEYRYDTNPAVDGNATALHRALIALFENLRSTFVLAAWPYLVVTLIAIGVAWRRRRIPLAQGALAACASGLLYALPLPVISPSAELRYLTWTCLAAILGAALALAANAARIEPQTQV